MRQFYDFAIITICHFFVSKEIFLRLNILVYNKTKYYSVLFERNCIKHIQSVIFEQTVSCISWLMNQVLTIHTLLDAVNYCQQMICRDSIGVCHFDMNFGLNLMNLLQVKIRMYYLWQHRL